MLSAPIEKQLDSTFPVMQALPASLRRSVTDAAMHMAMPQGATLFDEGAGCHGFPLVLSGLVRVSKSSPEGREMLLYEIEPGQLCLMSSSCLLGKVVYTARGIVRANCELILLPPPLFDQLLNQYPPFRTMVFQLFADRMVELMELVAQVAFQRLDQRLANLLLSRGDEILTSHQSLADELGSVRVIVSRLLRNFEEQGWLALSRERIRILNRAGLEQLAGRF